jgi:hypothetical protein
MGPDLRTALLVGGLAFVALFALMTLAVALEHGVNILIVVSIAIVAMLGLALVNALRDPPDD